MSMTQTQQHNVPSLRFSEFSGGWETKQISEVSDKVTDGTHDTPKPVSDGVPFVTAIHVKDGSIDFDNCYFLQEDVHREIYRRCNPEKGDLLMVNIGAGTATSAMVQVSYEFSMKNVALIKPNRKLLSESFFAQRQRESSPRRRHQLTSGGAQPFLSLKQIGKLKLTFPALPEQQKIASFLSSIDDKIEQLGKKKTFLEQYKKGMMQKLFSQKLRFKDAQGNDFPEWEEKRLGDVSTITTGKKDVNEGNPNGKYPFFTCAKRHTYSDHYSFDCSAILIAGNGDVGHCQKFTGKFEAYQRTYVLSDFSLNFNYMFVYLSTKFADYVESQKQMGAMPYIKLGALNTFPIPKPSPTEQQKIADFLSSIEQKVELVATELDHARTFKKGLLQQMFI